ncbi:MAG: DNA polymerase III subunit alpha, partial [Proteobacteria bacterium]|nr:DNA polymerase III subunit alpha [Pseudomonadota bacterium]
MPLQPIFIHLRTHSAYSLSEGAIQVKDLVKLAVKNKMPALALTDTGNLFGSLEFSVAAAEAGVQPIIGVSLSLVEKEPVTLKESFSRILLLAKNDKGYKNLLHLVSLSFTESRSLLQPAVAFADLEGHTEGLIALTGGTDGPLAKPLLQGQQEVARRILGGLQERFRDNLYIELQRHGIKEEQAIEKSLVDLAMENDIPLVATNDVYFTDAEMFEAHDALICVADGRYLAEENRRRFTPEHGFKSADDMAKLFADIPEAIANTVVIAKRCGVMSEQRKPMLPTFTTEAGRSQEDELRHIATEGLKKRLTQVQPAATEQAYFDRLDFEMNVINKMGFAGYFLIVSDFIRWAKANGIPVGPGRGSGAGSVVAWTMEITDLDPLRFGLLFERFLNPERVSMPDFDVDFCQDRRDEVIRYVQQRYGRDRVAQIITFGKLQARAVLRDVGRVLQMPYGQVDRICKMIPFNPQAPVTLSEAIEMDSELQKERDSDPSVARLLSIGLKLEGLYRHASTHAAGVVIAGQPLTELIPLYYDPRSDIPVTQYAMKHAEMAGLVKFDFLGLKTLTLIDNACKLIRDAGGSIEIEKIPFDDKPTYAMLAKGDTTGVFQMESAGMRDALRKMRPDTIEDIIALISLYRPGPMENIPTYIARKHGREKPDYLHPKLEGILKETFGVIIYQEQVMQIAQVLSGYTLGGADLLRRAMGKKIKAEMDAQEALFVDGAKNNNVDPEQAKSIFELVAKFAGYGFNKSHAAAYAVIGYQTAYLKANFPVEYYTASMNIDMGDTDKINTYRREAMKAGITILPPDINRSGAQFITERLAEPKPGGRKRAIRYALGALKN